MVGKIEKRFGAEVYVSEAGAVCIRQEQEGGTEVLVFRPGEIPDLIELLQLASKEALAAEEEEDDNPFK